MYYFHQMVLKSNAAGLKTIAIQFRKVFALMARSG
jgi:hypothetical protein